MNRKAAKSAAEARHSLAESYGEQGRGELLRGKYWEALVYLAESRRLGLDTPIHQQMRGLALAPARSQLFTLRGHQGRVWGATFSPNGKTILTAGEDGARLWDAEGGRSLFHLAAHRGPVRHAVFSPDGRFLATASWDGTLGLWEAS